jgi:hypothetical protein
MSKVVHGDVRNFMKAHVSDEACQDLVIKGMKFFRAGAAKLFPEMLSLAERGITAYPKSVYKK